MTHLIQWVCKKLLNLDLVLVDKAEYLKIQQQANQRLQQFKPECKLLESDNIKELEPNELKALLQELKSTKN